MGIPKDLLDILVCPLCRSDLREEGATLACTNPSCRLIFPVREDIPVMLIDEASRPCPKCAAQRDWTEERGELRCPKCGEAFRGERK